MPLCQITSYRVLFAKAALNEYITGCCVCPSLFLGVLSPKLAALNEYITGCCVCPSLFLGVLSPKLFYVPLTQKTDLEDEKKIL